MPRKSRIDSPGLLHHIMSRGIERRKVFDTDADREHFLERLGEILHETKIKRKVGVVLKFDFKKAQLDSILSRTKK